MSTSRLLATFGVSLMLVVSSPFGVPPSAAETPTGQFSCTLSSIWDLSGTYVEDMFGLEAELSLTHTPQGRLSGGITVSGCGVDCCDVKGKASGSVGGPSTQPRGVLTTAAKGKCDESGSQSSHTRFAFTLDPTEACLQGRITGSACAAAIGGCARVAPQEQTLCLPQGTDGTATLAFDLAPSGRKLTGAATLTLSSGRVLQFQVRGTYSAGNDTARLRLRGAGDSAAGCSLAIRMTGGTIVAVTGHAMGERINQAGCM
jgi:hypothetical protein